MPGEVATVIVFGFVNDQLYFALGKKKKNDLFLGKVAKIS